MRRWWALWLRLDFAALALLKRLLRQTRPSRPVRRLSFISFAHWAVVDRVPADRRGRRLPYPYILFQSNFNGAPHEYFEAFARGLTLRMRGLWSGAYGVPDAGDLTRFARYINRNWIATEHYYAAYPHASTKMVLSALALRRQFDEFAAEAPRLEPPEFAHRYGEFLARAQRHL